MELSGIADGRINPKAASYSYSVYVESLSSAGTVSMHLGGWYGQSQRCCDYRVMHTNKLLKS